MDIKIAIICLFGYNKFVCELEFVSTYLPNPIYLTNLIAGIVKGTDIYDDDDECGRASLVSY